MGRLRHRLPLDSGGDVVRELRSEAGRQGGGHVGRRIPEVASSCQLGRGPSSGQGQLAWAADGRGARLGWVVLLPHFDCRRRVGPQREGLRGLAGGAGERELVRARCAGAGSGTATARRRRTLSSRPMSVPYFASQSLMYEAGESRWTAHTHSTSGGGSAPEAGSFASRGSQQVSYLGGWGTGGGRDAVKRRRCVQEGHESTCGWHAQAPAPF